MAKRHIVFLHGWAGDTTSYGALPQLLKNEGYEIKELHLGNYTTGDDSLSIDDYSIAMEKAVNDPDQGISRPFDVIIHSTGALVVRNWLSYFYRNKTSPVKKFIMAAPANNGSLLAGWGKKLPWDWGNKILKALELGGEFTWKLNWDWMNNKVQENIAGLEMYHLQGTLNDIDFPGFLDKLDNIFDVKVPGFEEAGSDNTVRFCAANLNVKGIQISPNDTFSDDKVKSINNIPVQVFPNRSHFGSKHGILASITDTSNEVYISILNLLNGGPLTISPRDDYPPFAMLNIRVVDQLGNPHEEFIPRFYFGSTEEQALLKIAHRYENKEIDCYYLKVENLANITKFGFLIESNTIGNSEFKRSNTIDLHNPSKDIHFLERGKTHLVEIMIEKSVSKKAFSFINPK